MKETPKPDILDQAFDHLSKIPWLRKIMTSLWIVSTAYLGIAIIIECIALFIKKTSFRLELIKNIILFITINPFFGYLFYRWSKRESFKKIKQVE